jgi:hypothetical protein
MPVDRAVYAPRRTSIIVDEFADIWEAWPSWDGSGHARAGRTGRRWYVQHPAVKSPGTGPGLELGGRVRTVGGCSRLQRQRGPYETSSCDWPWRSLSYRNRCRPSGSSSAMASGGVRRITSSIRRDSRDYRRILTGFDPEMYLPRHIAQRHFTSIRAHGGSAGTRGAELEPSTGDVRMGVSSGTPGGPASGHEAYDGLQRERMRGVNPYAMPASHQTWQPAGVDAHRRSRTHRLRHDGVRRRRRPSGMRHASSRGTRRCHDRQRHRCIDQRVRGRIFSAPGYRSRAIPRPRLVDLRQGPGRLRLGRGRGTWCWRREHARSRGPHIYAELAGSGPRPTPTAPRHPQPMGTPGR